MGRFFGLALAWLRMWLSTTRWRCGPALEGSPQHHRWYTASLRTSH